MYVATGHGKQGIRVNTIVPGLIITDAVRAHLTDDILAGLGRATLTPISANPTTSPTWWCSWPPRSRATSPGR